MATSEAQVDDANNDIDMSGGDVAETAEETTTPIVEESVKQLPFLEYLKSPIIELDFGTGSGKTALTAHQAFLDKSPFLAEACAKFPEGSSKKRRIDLPDEDLEAVGSVLEYLYNDEYFPKWTADSRDIETDPSIPSPDDEGAALLKHARVYTLAEKFRLPDLKALAHSKIHRTQSTARGEIAYARYVYRETSRDDTQIRRPVAAFWATRSHVLRHEAKDEFRVMCLEFPQFGFDVLSLVLDQKEKGKAARLATDEVDGGRVLTSTPVVHSGRKRARMSTT